MKSDEIENSRESKPIPWSELTEVQRTIVRELEEDSEGLASTQELVDTCEPSETTVRKHLKELKDDGVVKKREFSKDHIWLLNDGAVQAQFTAKIRRLLPSKWSSTENNSRIIRLEMGLAVFGAVLWMIGPVLVILPVTLVALELSLPFGSLGHWLLIGWAVPLIGFALILPALLGVLTEIFQLGFQEYRQNE